MRDDEGSTHGNEVRALRIARSAVTQHAETLLSPCLPAWSRVVPRGSLLHRVVGPPSRTGHSPVGATVRSSLSEPADGPTLPVRRRPADGTPGPTPTPLLTPTLTA
ncbi:hypothetical protein GT021_32615 [Streptomyces sp. SID5470]|nr:hypothetical protein [Streptomyces sp. SID5470]